MQTTHFSLKMNAKHKLLLILSQVILYVSGIVYLPALHAQSGMIEFGKNRVQYRQFDWQFYETDHFNVYFYQGGQEIGKYVILSAEKSLEEVTEKLDFRLSNKMDVIVYNDISDLHQTNIGINFDKEKISGTTQIINNTMFLYFNGDHRDIDRQIKEGITRVYLQKITMGSGFQEVLQNAVMLNIPDWFSDGLIAYAGQPWSTDLDNQLKDGISSGKYRDLSKITQEEMAFVGHSLWNYLELKYGENAVPNLLYLVRINKSVDRAFVFVTGKELSQILEEWYYFHLERFKAEKEIYQSQNFDNVIELKRKKNFELYEAKLSPDGRKIAYAINNSGRWKVLIHDLESKKTQTILKGGFKTNTLITDLSNPMINWHKSGRELAIIFEKKDLFYLSKYETEKFKSEKPIPMRNFQKIYGFTYEDNRNNLVISGMQRSQVDIFRYFIPTTRTENITNDFYDDLQPAYAEIDGRQGVLFISNRENTELIEQRLDTILPNGNFDVFFYDFNSPTEPLIRITNTPLANESHPMPLSDSQFTFLSDFTGIRNRYNGKLVKVHSHDNKKYFYYTNENPQKLDSITLHSEVALDSALAPNETLKEIVKTETIPVIVTGGESNAATNLYRGLETIFMLPESNYLLESGTYHSKKQFFKVPAEDTKTKVESIETTLFMSNEVNKFLKETTTESKVKSPLEDTDDEDESTEVKREVIYQSKFDGVDKISEAHKQLLEPTGQDADSDAAAYKLSRTRQYFLKFKSEEIATGLDNSLMVTQYQPFNPGNPVFNQPGINAMISFGITDLFEDHKIHGGFRLPIGFGGSELYATYNNYKKRWDKSLTFYRRVDKQDASFNFEGLNQPINGTLNTRTTLVESQFSYPFNEINSLRFKGGFRTDRSIIKSTDFNTLNAPNSSQNWLTSRVEFVHDNSIRTAMNIRNGFRLNVHYEFHKQIPTREDTIFNNFNVQMPQFENSYMMVWGFDARHYQKIYKNIIWANRFAYNTSVGTRKLIYYLGGTDNLLLPQFNQETPINPENTYAFQTLAYNMRGFQQNIRNGNSYMVFNSELRMPLFSTFSRTPLKSQLLEHFQLVGFFDAGTAWEGFTPFRNDNPLFKETISNSGGSAVVRLQVQKQPIVFSYGFGLRTTLLGYYIRTDIGWGYDTGTINRPRFQLSLGFDF
jgi:hypothetical protein